MGSGGHRPLGRLGARFGGSKHQESPSESWMDIWVEQTLSRKTGLSVHYTC